jgi:hypothetical protein
VGHKVKSTAEHFEEDSDKKGNGRPEHPITRRCDEKETQLM